MPIPASMRAMLTLPAIAAPMFLVSGPELVINTCKAGVVGTFPALNARTDTILDEWLSEIDGALAAHRKQHPQAAVAPYGVNLIVHKTNPRLQANLEMVIKHRVPVVITSLGAAKDVINSVHRYGGLVLHDVTNVLHAKKAADAGVDGLILVCAGAGGHAGPASPFALLPRIREFFKGIVVLAGAISDGRGIRTAEVLGADFAYLGTRFIATRESLASDAYKQMLINYRDGPPPSFLPTVYTDKISGVHANFLRASLENSGLDPDDPQGEGLGQEDFSRMSTERKAWKDVWSAGHGTMVLHDIPPVADLIKRMRAEYDQAANTPKF